MDYAKLFEIKEKSKNYWSQRFVGETEYAIEISKVNDGKFDELICNVIEKAYACYSKGEFGEKQLKNAETELAPLSELAKEITVHCVSHAHIDLNWRWTYDETVFITLNTFKTMLKLMDEYPDFKFSQSQAALYKVVEKYDPEMLEKIKERVNEGRWEVVAATWSEGDKNIPNGEDLAMQLLTARSYLIKLFGKDKIKFDLDFEPDTFGHSVNVPTVLSNAGIKYYYHTRGLKELPYLFKWKAPSGKYVISCKDVTSYNGKITPSGFSYIPKFVSEVKMSEIMRVYGVGDHGGGATRKDIEAILDMQTWPLMPKLVFSTYDKFFAYVESIKDTLPEFCGENNYFFPGCYSSQTRIKNANRQEQILFRQTEQICAFGKTLGVCEYPYERIEERWREHSFMQFHDIICGCNSEGSLHYALANSQKTKAELGVLKSNALAAVSQNIDMNGFDDGTSLSLVEGVGTGYATNIGIYSGAGGKFNYITYNNSAFDGEYTVRLTLWDYPCNINQIKVVDANNNALPFNVVTTEPQYYWMHVYYEIDVLCKIPAFGYTVLGVRNDSGVPYKQECFWSNDGNAVTNKVPEYVLENDYVRAQFDNRDMSLISLIDKTSGVELLGDGKKGVFTYTVEDTYQVFDAWSTGAYKKRVTLNESICVKPREFLDGIMKKLVYEFTFENTVFCVEISLGKKDKGIKYRVYGDFNEKGVNFKHVPNLSFTIDVDKESKYLFDVPFGLIERAPMDEDQIANSFVYCHNNKNGFIFTSVGKNSFRAVNGQLNMILIRGTTDPDPFSENYHHDFTFGIIPQALTTHKQLIERAEEFNNQIVVMPMSNSEGNLSRTLSLFKSEGGAVISAVKMSEDKKLLCVRLYNAEENSVSHNLYFNRNIANAYISDVCEESRERIFTTGNELSVCLNKGDILTILIDFA